MKPKTALALAILAIILGFTLAQTAQIMSLDRETQALSCKVEALLNEQES